MSEERVSLKCEASKHCKNEAAWRFRLPDSRYIDLCEDHAEALQMEV